MKQWVYCLPLFLLILQPAWTKILRIAGVFDQEDKSSRELLKVAFESAVSDVNRERMVAQTSLSSQIEDILPGNSFKAGKRVCEILRGGAAAVFGPTSETSANHISSICNALKIPHIETTWRYDTQNAGKRNTINLYPHPSKLSQAFRDVILTLNWKNFAFLYEDSSGLIILQDLFKAAADLALTTGNLFDYSVRRLDPSGDFRPLLKSLYRKSVTNLVVDCHKDTIPKLLQQASEVSMMSDYHSYFFTSLDLTTLDLSEFLKRDTNITGFRMIDPSNHKLITTINNWKYMGLGSDYSLDITAETVTLEIALLQDAIRLYAHALRDESARGNAIHARPLLCDSDQKWDIGDSIVHTMRTLNMPDGFTGFVKLDSNGMRTEFSLDFILMRRNRIRKLGHWDTKFGYKSAQTSEEISKETEEELARKTLIVTTALSAPYTFKRSADSDSPDENFEGYAVDLIHEISKIQPFKFKFKLVEDGSYGKKDARTGEWNGMIRELLDGKADLALVDLTITHERLKAVDFTTPFMNLGISILFTKPRKQDPQLFSFLSPLSMEVWMFMSTAYLGVSLLLFLLARISPDEWGNPYPCIEDPENLENDFTIVNSMWFTIGSLMQQGSDIAPKAISTRMVASIWWFFTLIMISSYTANLAAFLTVSRMDSPIKGAEDLAKQTKIKYGTLTGGSTYGFFQKSSDPIFKRMFMFMNETSPPVYVKRNQDGVDRVLREQGMYAYLMESTSIDYQVERSCNLMQIGGLLDSKGYGIAMPPNSRYRSSINDAILKLQEKNTLYILKQRWWKKKGGGGECQVDEVESNELTMDNVGGVFVVLIGGMGVAILIAIVEFIWKSRKLALEERASLWVEMAREISFAFRCKGNTKPVVRKPPEGKPFLSVRPEWGFEESESNKSDVIS